MVTFFCRRILNKRAAFLCGLLLLLGCVKSPCIITVNVTFKNSGVSATAVKKVKCGDYISFPLNTATKSPAFIEINFFQGLRVVRADVVFGDEFNNESFFREYDFPDTNPDLMIWRVYQVDRTWGEYRTKIE